MRLAAAAIAALIAAPAWGGPAEDFAAGQEAYRSGSVADAAAYFTSILGYAGWASEGNAVAVDIDIAPGSDANIFRLGPGATVTVAILSSDRVDALREVDADTLFLTAPGIKLVAKGDAASCRAADVNADALADLVCEAEAAPIAEPGDAVVALEAALRDRRALGCLGFQNSVRGEGVLRAVAD